MPSVEFYTPNKSKPVIEHLLSLSNFSLLQASLACAAVFCAGLVRGFAGFGLSAVMMASVVTLVPPVSLIPVCFMLETAASLVMFKGGVKQADMRIVWGLVIGSVTGLPLGLYATNSLDSELSKLIALLLILVLALTQLFKLKPTFLATRPGLYLSGLISGIATGLASVGGMVVALYILASDAEPKRMRASLVMYLFLGMFTSFAYLSYFGMFTAEARWRVLILTPVMLLGLFVGTRLFRPSLEPYYKPACLVFLMLLCAVGLFRQLVLG